MRAAVSRAVIRCPQCGATRRHSEGPEAVTRLAIHLAAAHGLSARDAAAAAVARGLRQRIVTFESELLSKLLLGAVRE